MRERMVAWLLVIRLTGSGLVVGAGFLDYAAPAIKAVGRNAMTQVGLTRLRVDRQRGSLECGVRTMHATLGWGLAALLYGHFPSLLRIRQYFTCVRARAASATRQTAAASLLPPRRPPAATPLSAPPRTARPPRAAAPAAARAAVPRPPEPRGSRNRPAPERSRTLPGCVPPAPRWRR